ncbi:uncharacterized protein LOC132700896 isoform X2 [Cylas formicarius]|uniref:uncharacterized protein LOC132700896 isoform X2 n=1 Tax=Cylas formicarius TaxID=197179 RepID=UPI002958815F|nr:uncharacterized protein LOC132700896 isoform X2 [Cylas formicarius]
MMTGADDYLKEIIRLQLKKPKNWRWELSTSKSSPHIAMPTIQLYNSKGHLIVETNDKGGTKRQTWHSSRFDEEPPHVRKRPVTYLQRCRSDDLERKICSPRRINGVKFNKTDKTDVASGKWDKSGEKSPGAKRDYQPKKDPKQPDSNTGPGTCGGEGAYRLQKSRSDILGGKGNQQATTQHPKRFLSDAAGARRQRHSRSASDDLFKKMAKYKEESLKRAEIDGFRKFIVTDDIPLDPAGATNKKKNPTYCLATAETVFCDNRPKHMEITDVKEKKYKLRQSRAGILVISDESFSSNHRRRCHGEYGSRRESNEKENPDTFQPLSDPVESNFRCAVRRSRSEKNDVEKSLSKKMAKYTRQSSDPNAIQARWSPKRIQKLETERPVHSKTIASLCSKSDVFSCDALFIDDANVKMDVNCNYIVQEPLTTPNSDTAPVMVEKNVRKRLGRKKIRRVSDDSTSSGTTGHQKGHIIRAPKARGAAPQVTDCDLLRLARHLSSLEADDDDVPCGSDKRDRCGDYDHHVSMGANVSRHSSKGLSGRRSQSSGSICNSKGGRQAGDGSKCGGSLPSYLDDNESTYNNNHQNECQKQPIDEVDRIPPLGDGAPLHWKFSDTQTALCQDQGYGSERSPEEEYPPPLPDHNLDLEQCHHHLEPHTCYPFITPESTFTVKLTKGSRGLGLSVTGGIDCVGSWPGLVRIKRLFPHQPAFSCGLLNVGDLLLEANGVSLTGLTNYEALEVLRTAANQVELRVCRPPPDVLNCVSPISEVPPPPPTRREPPNSLNLPPVCFGTTPEDEYYHGEFEVTLTKIQGSLGFTLRKEDDSALGHYVRALVREPALTDGRIRAGDKIIAVNDVEISPMTHEQAVQYLRQCGDKVKLRLYRDSAQTPVAALSPTETTPRTSFSRKANLRQEAVDMLNDIAVRKLIPGGGHESTNHHHHRSLSPNSSPRRLRRHGHAAAETSYDPSAKYTVPEESFHEGLLQKCPHYDDDAFNSLFSIESDDMDKPSRPSSLDLYNPNQTPVAARKPRFNFSLAHNAYELNNLDAEVLDAPNLTYNLGTDEDGNVHADTGDDFPKEPASMPHIPLDNYSKPFSYKHPAYQSAHPPCGSETSDGRSSSSKTSEQSEDSGTLKRKTSAIRREPPPARNDTRDVKPHQENYEILAIELNRGWNSRLGFSLQGAAGVTYVSAVHADSVAAKDGRIRPGDVLLKVNDESVEHLSTNEIIDLLRIVRGPVCIVVKRIKSNEDCPKSNAEN